MIRPSMKPTSCLLQMFFLVSFVTEGAKAESHPPVVYWSAEPVLPGEMAMLQGSGWGDEAVIAIERETNEEFLIVPPNDVSMNPRSVRFVVPEALKPGVRKCTITARSGVLTWTLNLPQVWWWQADSGRSATAGGWLRLFGRCLSFEGGKPSVELRRGAERTGLALVESLPWGLSARIPKSFVSGEYEVWVHNGTGGASAWIQSGSLTLADAGPPWKSVVVELTEFGAIPDDNKDDSIAFNRAIDVCSRNGGGTLAIPRGRFQLSGSFTLPARVLVKGAGMQFTHLVWGDSDTPPEAYLANSTGLFGMEDLSIYANNYDRGVVVKSSPASGATAAAYPSDVRLRRVRFRFAPFSVKNLSEAQQATRRKKLSRSAVLVIEADNVKVIDCDFAWTTNVGFSIQGDDVVCRRNTAHAEGGGWCPVGGGRRIICEDNDFSGTTTGVTRGAEVWFARNRVRQQYRGDREGFTTDGTFGGVGFLESFRVVKDSITFKAKQDRSEPAKILAAVRVIEGTGAGQYREAIRFGSRELKISRPFDVELDETSVLWAANALYRHIVYANDFSDTGSGVQFFGGGLDCVIANNISARSGGFRAWGNDMCHYVQMLSNVITEGYGTAGQESYAGVSSINVIGPWVNEFKGTTVRGCVLRRNVIQNNATITLRGSIHDVLVEANDIRHSSLGIVGDLLEGQDGIVLRNNSFQDVDQPFFPESIRQRYTIMDATGKPAP